MRTAELDVENGAARLAGDLTFSTVAGLYERMRSVTKDSGLPARIDLSGVGRIDSAGLALLLEWQAEYRGQSGNGTLIAIQEPPQALMKIARLCGAEEYLAGAPGSQAEGQADERG